MDSPRFDAHDPGRGHPESPRRLAAIREAFAGRGLDAALTPARPEPASRAALERVHDAEHIDRVERLCEQGGGALDPDTPLSAASFEAAVLAAGAAVGAVQRVLSGEWKRAFCSVRPPGHHAARRRGGGFCVFNSVAVAASAALASGGVRRVAIVDFDAHHGDGTQSWCETRSDALYASFHQWPHYPGTGGPRVRGETAPNVVNCPLAAGARTPAVLSAWRRRVRPALMRFAPELILLSAGFDGDARDPLSDLRLDAAGFFEVTREICAASEQSAAGRIVSVLEGGYHLDALGEDVVAHVEALLGRSRI